MCPAGSMHHELHVYYNIYGLGGQDSLKGVKLSQCPPPLNIAYSQSLSQWSKTHTSVADPGSTSGGTFQCMQFLPFFMYFSYLLAKIDIQHAYRNIPVHVEDGVLVMQWRDFKNFTWIHLA